MSSQSAGHGGHDDPEVHLPDPSVWPLVAGVAAAIFGAALIFWSRDRDNDFAGPLVGLTLLLLFLSAFGWGWQDYHMRRKAALGEHAPARRNPRFTQVVTFAIAEGQLAAARATDGIITELEGSDLRDVAGFQDLRIIVSPADVGPSQVLVETTWSEREDLATYEETRRSLVDRIARHGAEVVPGSVQVFDMEVVRDTKDTSFKFGLGAAASVFGALIVGGFMLGAGLTAFQEDRPVAEGGETPGTTTPDPYRVTATDNKFNVNTLAAPPNTQVTFTLVNNGTAPHNLAFYTDESASTPLAEGSVGNHLDGGNTEEITFTTPGPGTYYFHCDFHPDQMNGTFIVSADAPAPGGAGGGAGGGGAENGGGEAPAGGAVVNATDNKFDKASLEATAGQELTVTLNNKGKVPHNIHFYDKKGGDTLADGAEGAILQGGKTETLKFTPPQPGQYYYQCDLHPDQMNGTLTVK
ncbi:MAG: cupredoxin domain-containing protein [Hyphomicrobiales bacterium]